MEDYLINVKKLIFKTKEFSSESLLRIGRDLITESSYPLATQVFQELLTRPNMKEISQIYLDATMTSSVFNDNQFSKKYNNKLIDKIIELLSDCTNMHSEGNLSNEDLFTLERLVDRIPFKQQTIKGRAEFERLYGKFKEYSLNVFLKESKK